jgi:c(7)-type cytochrome triheme protein
MNFFAGLIFFLLLILAAEARIGGGDIKINEEVTFSHEWHVKEMGLSCTKCHPKLFITTAKRKPASAGKSAAAMLKNCLTCHGKKW